MKGKKARQEKQLISRPTSAVPIRPSLCKGSGLHCSSVGILPLYCLRAWVESVPAKKEHISSKRERARNSVAVPRSVSFPCLQYNHTSGTYLVLFTSSGSVYVGSML